MILKKIRLHPFAGFVDKTLEFESGLNVVLGNNEAGKSTIMKAIKMVLFEPTNLPPAAHQKLIKNLLPVDGGDMIAVDAEIESQGVCYYLTKQWGTPSFSSIYKKNEAPLTNPNDVQSLINQLLVQNRAVWEAVMFAYQAEMPITSSLMKEQGDVASNLDMILHNAIINNAGIAPEDIQSKIQEKLKALTDNWDLDQSKPLLGKNQKGSYDNPHQKNIGQILEQDYEIHRLQEALDKRKKYDEELDRVVREIETITNEYTNEVKEYLDEHRAHIDQYRNATNLKTASVLIETTYYTLKTDAKNWREASAQIKILEGGYLKTKGAQEELQKEMNTAFIKKQGETKKIKKGQIDRLLMERESLLDLQKKCIELKPELKEKIHQLQRRLNDEMVSFDALKKLQSFMVDIVSVKNLHAEIKKDKTTENRISLEAGSPYQFNADGHFELKTTELHIRVLASDQNLIHAEKKIKKTQEELLEICHEYQMDSIDGLLISNDEWEKIYTDIKKIEGDVRTLLGHEKFNELKKEVEQLDALPDSRSIETIQPLLTKATQEEAQSKVEFEDKRRILEKFSQMYGSLDKLEDDLLEKRNELDRSKNKLKDLGNLLQGQQSLTEVVKNYDIKLDQENKFKEALSTLREQKIRLESSSDDISALEYEDQIRFSMMKKNQCVSEAKALIVIQKKLQDIVSRIPSNPYDVYHHKMQNYLQILTAGKYRDLHIEKSIPAALKNSNNNNLTIENLSQGTSSILGMALRLSMADYFLKGRSGFLVFDDPMTDLDDVRQEATANCFKAYASKKQIIVFTCHATHASCFSGNSISI